MSKIILKVDCWIMLTNQTKSPGKYIFCMNCYVDKKQIYYCIQYNEW